MGDTGKLEELIRRIEADGQLTKDEINELNAALLADDKLSSDERMLLEGVLAKLRRGEIKEV